MRSVFFLLLALSVAQAQELPKDTNSKEPDPDAKEYLLGPGDSLSIRVFGLKEFEQSTRISNSGRIHVPYVGIISVANMTAAQLERKIASRIQEQQLVKEPWVRVQVEEHRSQPVIIIGELNTPGQFAITSEMYLLDLISKAGGLKPSASSEGFLYRRRDPSQPLAEVTFGEETGSGKKDDPVALPPPVAPPAINDPLREEMAAEKATRINLDELKGGQKQELNLRLRGGDVFYIPRRQQQNFFIVGDVNWPGPYTIPPGHENITATRAVSYAGGPSKTAKRKGFIMRHDDTGSVQELTFDFSAIIKGEKPDIPIRPMDIIVVPTSNVRTIGYALLLMMPRLVQQFLIF